MLSVFNIHAILRRKNMKKFALSAAAFAAHSILLAAGAHVVQTSGEGDSRPEDYVPPVIGNGSICTSIDNLGK